MCNKSFVRVSNSYRKLLWIFSQAALTPRVPCPVSLSETCSTPWSGLGDSFAAF